MISFATYAAIMISSAISGAANAHEVASECPAATRGYQSEEYYIEATVTGLDAAIEDMGLDVAEEIAGECGELEQVEADALCGDWIESCQQGEWESSSCTILDHAISRVEAE